MMQQLMQFLMNHWFLSALFVLILIWIFIEEARAKGFGGAGVTPQQATQLINRESGQVVDLRDANTFKDGHVVGAINAPLANFDNQVNRLAKHKGNPVIIVCSTGQRADKIVARLRKDGFEKVHILNGGMAAWKNASMPITTK